MKKVLLLLIMFAFMAAPAHAFYYFEPIEHSHSSDNAKSTLSVGLDAPKLIRFTNDFSFGVEGGKGLMKDVFHSGRSYFEDDHGYYIELKFTYDGTWFDFRR